MDEPQAPDGFRIIRLTQALIIYAEPLMEMVLLPPNDIQEMKQILNLGLELWNYTVEAAPKKSASEIISLICLRLKLDEEKAQDLLAVMVERRHFLFPPEVQPKESPYLFMRKEICYLIDKFDFETLDLLPEVLAPNTLEKD